MKSILSTLTRTLPILAITCAMAAFTAQPAAAQTAKKLNCTGCVKSKQLKNNGIKSTDIKNGQVKNADLGNDAVDSGKIADGAVGSADLANNAVTSGKIASDAVDGAKVKDGSLLANDLKDEPGTAFLGGEQEFVLTGSSQVVRTVTLVAPRAGAVIATASGEFAFGAGNQLVHCSINTGLFVEDIADFRAANETLSSFTPFSSTRVFVVPTGSFTVNLVCHEDVGTNTRVFNSNLVLLYVPTIY